MRANTIAARTKTNQTKSDPTIKHEDNTPTETKDGVPVAEALRREPPHLSLMRKRYKKPLKRYHTYSYSRPRRRPKPFYGPPSVGSFGKPLTDEFYEPTFSSPKKRKKSPPYKDLSGVIDTDIGKFFDPSPGTFEVQPYKTSAYLPSNSFLGSDFEIDDDTTGFDADTEDDDTTGVFKVQNSYSSDAAGQYAPSAVDFDNLFSTKQQATVYKTAPKSTKSKTKTKYSFAEPPTINFNSLPDYKATEFNPPPVTSFSQPQSPPYSLSAPPPITTATYSQPAVPDATYNQPPIPSYSPPPYSYNPPSLPPPTQFNPNPYNPISYTNPTQTNPSPTYAQPQQPPQVPTYSQPAVPSPTYNQPLLPVAPHNPKPLPPSTSYGVPIAPTLDAYQYHLASNQDAYSTQVNGQNYPPINFTPSQGIPQSSYIPQQIPINDVSNPKNTQNGYFAEPSAKESEEVVYESTKVEKPTRKRRPVKPVKIARIPSEKLNADEVADYVDEPSNTNIKINKYAQPALPHTYDQEQFELFAQEKRKMLLKQQQQLQKDFEKYDEFATYFKSATSKKPAKRPAVQTETPEFDNADDYYDDDVVTKVVTRRPTRYKKRPLVPTPVPEVEYDDEDSYLSESSTRLRKHPKIRISTQQQLRKKIPDSEPSESMEKTRKKLPTTRQPTRASNSSATTTRKHSSKTLQRGTLTPPAPGTQSDYKQYNIRQRQDEYSFKQEDARKIYLATQRYHKPYYAYPPSYNFSVEIHEYDDLLDDLLDRSDTLTGESSIKNFQVVKDINAHVGAINAEKDGFGNVSTIKVTTTKKPTSPLYVWDGKTLPKNHKMA